MAWSDDPDAAFVREWGFGGPAERYELVVAETFKGPAGNLAVFQWLDSGRFDLDVDKDYLLFLHLREVEANTPSQARDTYSVKFACGPSAPWDEVSEQDRQEVARLKAELR